MPNIEYLIFKISANIRIFLYTTKLLGTKIQKKRAKCPFLYNIYTEKEIYSSSLLVKCLSFKSISGFTLKAGAAGATFALSAGAP